MGTRGTVIFTGGQENFSPVVNLHFNEGPKSILIVNQMDVYRLGPGGNHD